MDESLPGGGPDVDRLTSLLYDDLRRLAHDKLRSERAGHTLDTVGLANETWTGIARPFRLGGPTSVCPSPLPTSSPSPA